MSRAQPPQQPAPVQRLRLRYAKRGRLRFASHRDFARAFERALRRAEIPMAYSSGFSPHPRISYANAAPTGAASEAEYLEIALVDRRDPEQVRTSLDSSLPVGLDVLQVVEASEGALADRLTGSSWRVHLVGAEPEVLSRAVAAFLAQEEVVVERMMKSGLRQLDTRAAVKSMTADHDVISVLVAHQTPVVRPAEIVAALRQVDPCLSTEQTVVATRTAQGVLTGLDLADPLA